VKQRKVILLLLLLLLLLQRVIIDHLSILVFVVFCLCPVTCALFTARCYLCLYCVCAVSLIGHLAVDSTRQQTLTESSSSSSNLKCISSAKNVKRIMSSKASESNSKLPCVGVQHTVKMCPSGGRASYVFNLCGRYRKPHNPTAPLQ
jgi:hypothetical protein